MWRSMLCVLSAVFVTPHLGYNHHEFYEVAAKLYSSEGTLGAIAFQQTYFGQGVLISAALTGISPGRHAVHIHSSGDLSDGCNSTGIYLHRHWIGNVEANANGSVTGNMLSPRLELYGPYGIVGRSVVIHANPLPPIGYASYANYGSDDQMAGEMLACGVISIFKSSMPPPQN